MNNWSIIFISFNVIFYFFHEAKQNIIHDKIQNLSQKSNHTSLIPKKEASYEISLRYPDNLYKTYKVKDMWIKYYDCLQNKEKKFNEKYRIEITRVLEGRVTKLRCGFCRRPFESTNHVYWKYKPFNNKLNTSNLEPLNISPYTTLDKEMTLIIFRSQREQSGLYICYVRSQEEAIHIVEIVENENIIKVQPITAPNGNHSTPNTTINNLSIEIYTKWSEWSECSKCGKVGKRYRVGICTITLLKDQNRLQNVNEENQTHFTNATFQQEIKSNNKKGYVTENYRNRDRRSVLHQILHTIQSFRKWIWKNIGNQTDRATNSSRMIDLSNNEPYLKEEESKKIFQYIQHGIPCRSQLLPKLYAQQQQIRTRPSEIMEGFCKVKCDINHIFEVRTKQGKILERVNNSAGIFSLLQNKPKITPNVERITIYPKHQSTITLICPGSVNKDIPISWSKGLLRLNFENIEKDSSGRIMIKNEHIIINKLRKSDGGLYSCWQREELVGVIRMHVVETFKLTFNHHFVLLGLMAIIITFLFIGYRIYKGRKRNYN